jgi:DNA-binding LytR/AlgR family response regulator
MHQNFFLQVTTNRLVQINSSDIYYIETENQFSKIITATATYRINIALYRLESLLPEDLFFRVNRSFIVSIGKISKIEEEAVVVKEREIYISKKCRNVLITRIKVLG